MEWKTSFESWDSFSDLNDFERQDLDRIKANPESLEEAFYQPLAFGTAGMRGVIGAGINRMNTYTVRQASQGLAQWIDELGPEAKQRGVAIAYDNRHFSPEFGQETAKILAKNGVKAYIFESLRSTPELSFAVRQLKTVAGVMITASHNPPEYNGYKVYDESGAQIAPNIAERVTQHISQVDQPLHLQAEDFESYVGQGLIEVIGEEVDQAYLDQVMTVVVQPQVIQDMADQLTIVFSPLHGAGQMIGERALRQAGFNQVHLVADQAVADPDFSTLASPNPEDPAAFELAIQDGLKLDADILMATDPDADRLGMAVKDDQGDYQVLTGNQIASLILAYLLKQGQPASDARLVKSIVSGQMPAQIAEAHGVLTDNVLTGFKFIADKISQYEDSGEASFLFGFEESYGYLVQPFVRDKDAIQTLVILAEMAGQAKQEGRNLYQVLQDLFEEYGYFLEKTLSIKMEGIAGSQRIQEILADFRDNPPAELAGQAIEVYEDYQSLERRDEAGQVSAIDSPPSNVLRYELADQAWVAIRPSGTEPKIKFYMGVKADSQAQAQHKLKALEAELRKRL